ncbi:hypothetical protein GCM10028807_09690 [Spirosoma daeguense]
MLVAVFILLIVIGYIVYILTIGNRFKPLEDIASKNDNPNKCIYCGGKPLTGEHVFADWYKNILPRRGNGKFIGGNTYTVNEDGTEKISYSDVRYKGHAAVTKLRIVCQECNTGWGSQLQNVIKPILIPLMLDQEIILDKVKQRKLAAWATMTTIIGERVYEPPYAIHNFDRAYFYYYKRALPNWYIWIGRNKSKYKLNTTKLALYFRLDSDNSLNFDERQHIPRGLFYMYFVENFMFVCLKADPIIKTIILPKELEKKLIMLHPIEFKELVLKSLEPIDNRDKDIITAFFSTIGNS